jgi:subtilisin family serine protease
MHPSLSQVKFFLCLWSLLFCLSLSGATVDPEVTAAVSSGGTCSFIIVMNEQADLSGAASFSTKEEKAWYVFDTLKSKAEQEQAPVLEECSLGGYEVQPFWIVNMILVKDGDESLVQSLAQNPYVWRITENRRFYALPETTEKTKNTKAEELLWNLNHVQAPEVWATGVEGEGIVVGGQDTGYEWDHAALRDQYRGYDRGNVNHDYCWHDSIHVDNDTCPGNSPVPCADGYHGTHTMGTVLGQTATKTIGVAPKAKWIGCRNMKGGWGTPGSYIECFQWFLAPTRINGSDADPLMAPDVMVNSWGCPEEEGCIEPEILRPAVQAMLSAGIFVEVSAGNDGPGCGSVSMPPSFYEEVFSVGATDVNKHIAMFSSRGFVDIDGSYRMKPDISAPGVDVYSCVPGGYAFLSGTSMAGPHVAGVVALILSAVPQLRGQVETVIEIIQ